MRAVPRFSGSVVLCLAVALFTNTLTSTLAEVQSGQVEVLAVQGDATYLDAAHSKTKAWLPLKANAVLGRGTVIKTGSDAAVDLILQYNGTVLRLIANSELRLEKLNKEDAGESTITETSLKLVAGSLIGSQRKLTSPSVLEINIPGGSATIRGTEYVVRADGAVSCISGTVRVNYNLPGNGGSVMVDVPAGYSFNPATGQVVKTTGQYLQNLIADINTVRMNAMVFKAGGATIVVQPEQTVTPTHGNNGVGNGQDPQPPGNPPINDGPGTGPGNPGNRGHGHTTVVRGRLQPP